MDVRKFEELVKHIDKKKYHISRTLEIDIEGRYISDWAIFRKDMSIEEYFDPDNLAVLSSAHGNTLEDIEEFILREERLKYYKNWRKKNKSKVKKHNQKYYYSNREKILQRRKEKKKNK